MDRLTDEQLDLLKERTLIMSALEISFDYYKGQPSEGVSKQELKVYSKSVWNAIAKQNWINTEKPN
jgi:hypothetical protein